MKEGLSDEDSMKKCLHTYNHMNDPCPLPLPRLRGPSPACSPMTRIWGTYTGPGQASGEKVGGKWRSVRKWLYSRRSMLIKLFWQDLGRLAATSCGGWNGERKVLVRRPMKTGSNLVHMQGAGARGESTNMVALLYSCLLVISLTECIVYFLSALCVFGDCTYLIPSFDATEVQNPRRVTFRLCRSSTNRLPRSSVTNSGNFTILQPGIGEAEMSTPMALWSLETVDCRRADGICEYRCSNALRLRTMFWSSNI